MKKIIRLLALNKTVGQSSSSMKFAIRKTQRGNEVEFLPVAKLKGWFVDWITIVEISAGGDNKEYVLLPLEPKGLSHSECVMIIERYKDHLDQHSLDNYVATEYMQM